MYERGLIPEEVFTSLSFEFHQETVYIASGDGVRLKTFQTNLELMTPTQKLHADV